MILVLQGTYVKQNDYTCFNIYNYICRINSLHMQNRLQKLIDSEQLTPAKFAEILGVQRSAISHIITGRNKPSYDLINKILSKFPSLNSEWLITGKGDMYRAAKQRSLFDFEPEIPTKKSVNESTIQKSTIDSDTSVTDIKKTSSNQNSISNTDVTDTIISKKIIRKIVVFYSDSTFEEFITNP